MANILKVYDKELGQYVSIPTLTGPAGPAGERGETGLPGTVYGSAQPEVVDGVHPIWIDPTGSNYVEYINRNHLDNWDFLNPVNQRGVSGVISTAGYFLDRWILEEGTVEITSNGLVLNGTIIQKLEFPTNQPMKASALTTTGIIDASYSEGNDGNVFSITGEGITLIAAKLELGEFQTLAKEVDGEWLLNEIPDYGMELIKCKRFYTQTAVELAGGRDCVHTGALGSYWFPTVFFDVRMRTIPAITIYSALWYESGSTGKVGMVYDPVDKVEISVAISESYISENGFTINNGGGNLTSGRRHMFHYVANAEL